MKAFTQSDSIGGSMDLTPLHILRLAHQEGVPDWGQSMISTIGLLAMELQVGSKNFGPCRPA